MRTLNNRRATLLVPKTTDTRRILDKLTADEVDLLADTTLTIGELKQRGVTPRLATLRRDLRITEAAIKAGAGMEMIKRRRALLEQIKNLLK